MRGPHLRGGGQPLNGRMDFIIPPDIGPLLFSGLTLASFATAFIGVFTGTAGGLILLAIITVLMFTGCATTRTQVIVSGEVDGVDVAAVVELQRKVMR